MKYINLMIKNKELAILVASSLLVFFIYLKLRFIRLKNTLKKILEDNHLIIKDKTKFKVKKNEIIIKNYKTKESVDEIILSNLKKETNENYFIKERKHGTIKISKFPELPRQKGIYLQDVANGKIEEFNLEKLKNWNGLFVAATSGAGKSVLVKELIKNKDPKNIFILSPKGDEDFENAKSINADTISELEKIIDNYKNLENETIVIIDEMLTFNAIAKITNKEILKKMSLNFTLNRSSRLKYILITQTLTKNTDLSIDLLNHKILNVSNIANFLDSLGIGDLKTEPASLAPGEFVYLNEGREKILTNKI